MMENIDDRVLMMETRSSSPNDSLDDRGMMMET